MNRTYRMKKADYDFIAAEQSYEAMARKGWKLEKTGTFLDRFVRAEPLDCRYRIEFRKTGNGEFPQEERELIEGAGTWFTIMDILPDAVQAEQDIYIGLSPSREAGGTLCYPETEKIYDCTGEKWLYLDVYTARSEKLAQGLAEELANRSIWVYGGPNGAAQTADDRFDCRFDCGVMQSIVRCGRTVYSVTSGWNEIMEAALAEAAERGAQ